MGLKELTLINFPLLLRFVELDESNLGMEVERQRASMICEELTQAHSSMTEFG